MANHLYFGDNLGVLREQVRDESVDLVYLDCFAFLALCEGMEGGR